MLCNREETEKNMNIWLDKWNEPGNKAYDEIKSEWEKIRDTPC